MRVPIKSQAISHVLLDGVAANEIGSIMCFCATSLWATRCSRHPEVWVMHHCHHAFSVFLSSKQEWQLMQS